MSYDPMPPPDHDPAALRALLETLLQQQGGCVDVPPVDDLVHWLDRTLPPERHTQIETALARLPELRRALTAARLGKEEAVPLDELARLEALVPADIVPFPARSARSSRRELLVAAAVAALLLAPAWIMGTKFAEQRAAVENRELKASLADGLLKGGM
jgi:hypothetical protein